MTRIMPMGLTVAIPAEAVNGHTREEVRRYVQRLSEEAQAALQVFVGHSTPQGPLAVNLAGPVDDPLQGLIYGLTVAAPFDADALPVTCDAYLAYSRPDIGSIQYDQGPLTRDLTQGGSDG